MKSSAKRTKEDETGAPIVEPETPLLKSAIAELIYVWEKGAQLHWNLHSGDRILE